MIYRFRCVPAPGSGLRFHYRVSSHLHFHTRTRILSSSVIQMAIRSGKVGQSIAKVGVGSFPTQELPFTERTQTVPWSWPGPLDPKDLQTLIDWRKIKGIILFNFSLYHTLSPTFPFAVRVLLRQAFPFVVCQSTVTRKMAQLFSHLFPAAENRCGVQYPSY